MRRKSINKQQIIEAAAAILAEKGLEHATVDDIAAAAGVAKGSIYNYFSTKEQIFAEGTKFFAEKRISTLRKLLEKYASAREKLAKLMEANQAMAERQPDLFFMNYAALLNTHATSKTKLAYEFFEKYVDFVQELIDAGQKSGEFEVVDSRLAAQALVLTQDLSLLITGGAAPWRGSTPQKLLTIILGKDDRNKR